MNDDTYQHDRPSLLAVLAETDDPTIADSAFVPVLIANEGAHAAWRYIDFFTENVRNPNTRRAYIRACEAFLAWCEQRRLTLATIRPFDVSTFAALAIGLAPAIMTSCVRSHTTHAPLAAAAAPA